MDKLIKRIVRDMSNILVTPQRVMFNASSYPGGWFNSKCKVHTGSFLSLCLVFAFFKCQFLPVVLCYTVIW